MKFVQILCCAVLVACLISLAPSPAEAGKKKMVKSAALLALVLKNHFHKQLGFFPLPLPIPVAIEQKLPPKPQPLVHFSSLDLQSQETNPPSYNRHRLNQTIARASAYPQYPSYPSYPSYPQPSYQQPSYAASYQEPTYSQPSYEGMDSYATNDHQTYSANNNQYDLSQYASVDEGSDYAPQY